MIFTLSFNYITFVYNSSIIILLIFNWMCYRCHKGTSFDISLVINLCFILWYYVLNVIDHTTKCILWIKLKKIYIINFIQNNMHLKFFSTKDFLKIKTFNSWNQFIRNRKVLLSLFWWVWLNIITKYNIKLCTSFSIYIVRILFSTLVFLSIIKNSSFKRKICHKKFLKYSGKYF